MSNLVLYRKYRPINFSDVTSQEHVKTTLKNAVKNNRAGHAYLFTGPRGVGKTTIARIFARAVNCPNGKDGPPRIDSNGAVTRVEAGEPCNTCDICKEFLAGNSLDIIEIDAASHTGVDNIRELIEHLQFAPTRAKFKVIIIDEVHMLSKGAFNALLKTLEEPPAHALFVLATTEIHKVPATIVSRTQRFDFKKATVADLVQRLAYVCKDNQVEATEEALVVLAAAADGSFRDGLSLLDQVMNFASGKIEVELVEDVLGLTSLRTTYEFLDLIFENKSQESVDFILKLTYSGKDLFQFHKDLMEYMRKVLIVKIGAKSDFGFSPEMIQQMKTLSEKVSLERLVAIIEIFQKAGSELRWSSIQSLPLELAAVEAIQEGRETTTQSKPSTDRHAAAQEDSQNAAARDGHVDPGQLQTIQEAWNKILEKLKDYNHSLIPSLKLAKPVAVEGKELLVTFPYKFHQDAVGQRKNKIVVDQVIEEVTGLKLMIKPILQKDFNHDSNNDNNTDINHDNLDSNLMESALKIMGGEVET